MKLLRIHCFQHVEFEDLGCIKEWCVKNGHPVTCTRFYKNESPPKTGDFDWLIIMGGPMGVHEDEKYGWLSHEKEAIKMAIEHNKTILGICLGSQLVAEVLGARVYKNPKKEIGWFDIMLTEQGKNIPLINGMQPVLKVFHWHGDTFDLPQNAIPVFYSEACRNQAFLYKDKVLGLQFHFEVTEQSIKAMIENGKHELTGERTIQTEKEMISFMHYVETGNKAMFQVLDYMAK